MTVSCHAAISELPHTHETHKLYVILTNIKNKPMISKVILNRIKEMSEDFGIDPNVYLLDKVLLSDLDATSKAVELARTAKQILKEAREKITHDESKREASECIWTACVLAIKAHALYNGKDIDTSEYDEVWKYKLELERKLDNPIVDCAFRHALTMFLNAHNDWAPKEDVEKSYEKVKRLVDLVSEIVEA